MAFTTRYTVIERLKAGEGIAWEEFAGTYKKLVYLRAGDRGLFDHEKADLLQEVMLSLFNGNTLFKYEKDKGRFRDYLKKIIDRRAFDILRKRKDKLSPLQSLEQGGAQLKSEEFEQAEQRWKHEWQRHLIHQAMDKVQSQVTETTFQAFVLLCIDQLSAKSVSETLNISMESVYVAKHRVLKRLKPIITSLIKEEK